MLQLNKLLLSSNNSLGSTSWRNLIYLQELSLRLLKPSTGVRCYTYAAGGKVPETTKLIINGKFEESQAKDWIDVHSESARYFMIRSFMREGRFDEFLIWRWDPKWRPLSFPQLGFFSSNKSKRVEFWKSSVLQFTLASDKLVFVSFVVAKSFCSVRQFGDSRMMAYFDQIHNYPWTAKFWSI